MADGPEAVGADGLVRATARVPAELWRALGVVAAARGLSANAGVVEAIAEWVERHGAAAQAAVEAARRPATRAQAEGPRGATAARQRGCRNPDTPAADTDTPARRGGGRRD